MASKIYMIGETQPFIELNPFIDCRQIREFSKESISGLFREDVHGLLIGHYPTLEDLKLLDENLGQSFQPMGFPVFVGSGTREQDSGMVKNSWVELAPAADKTQVAKLVQNYNLKKETTHRWLIWGTLFALVVLFYLVLKGAGLWLPWGSLELRVAKFLEQDDPRIEVRLSGSLDDLMARKAKLENLANAVERTLLPADLSYVLASRKKECERYIQLFKELTSQPAHQSFKQIGELEVFVKSLQNFATRFPEPWHKTSAYLYWQNRLKVAEAYQSAFQQFRADYESRRNQLLKIYKLDGLQPAKEIFLEPWVEAQQKIIKEPWCDADTFLSQSHLSVVLEMRLYIHQLQKDLLQFFEWVRCFREFQIPSDEHKTKIPVPLPTFSSYQWDRFSAEQKTLLKDLAKPLLTKMPELKKTDHEKANQLELFQKLLENQAPK
jgi:hypothetical protein